MHGEVERIEKKLNNAGFMAKAPEKVVAEEKAKMADYMEFPSLFLMRCVCEVFANMASTFSGNA